MSKAIWSLGLMAILAGCGRNDADPKIPPAASEVAEVTPVPDGTGETSAPLVFRVVGEDGDGIDAVIKKIDLQNNSSNYARVPASGIKVMDKACDADDLFQAHPMADAFQLEPPKDCSARVEFKLLSTRVTFAFMMRGEEESAAGNFTLAQSSYGIAADRLAYVKPEESKRLRVLSQVAAGRALGVTQPVVGEDGNEQPTKEFEDRVRVFQRENGIAVSGKLDEPTRRSMTRMTLRGNDVVVTPAATLDAPNGAVATAAQLAVPTPPLEVRFSTAEMLAIPAAPDQAAVIHANRRHVERVAKP